MDDRLVPTGEAHPVTFQNPVSLADYLFDDGFTDCIPNQPFSIEGRGKKIEVTFGPKYTETESYTRPKAKTTSASSRCQRSPTESTSRTRANTVAKRFAPGATWQESFWIAATL